MTFQNLGLSAPILTALEEQGYTAPSPIQEKAIPPALEGRDVLGCAQTGTGKTCAFSAPILQRLAKPAPGHPIRALILTPTRELAIQIGESLVAYGSHMPLRSAVIFGGVAQGPQVAALKRGVDILVATPGRLGDLYQQKLLDLSKIEIFVLDEADRMLDMGFIHDVRKILKWLPEKKQTMLFSATMPPEIKDLVDSLLHNPARVAVNPVSSPVEAIDQRVYLVDRNNKTKLLAHLVGELGVKNALVFTRTKHGANKVARDLQKQGILAAAIHGNKSQSARQQALSDFKSGKIRCLVATDIAARGLDIEELSHVFNYNLPEVPETYIHRIGRTGRAGREGKAVAFCDFGEKALLKDIEKLMGIRVPLIENHPWPMEVFEAPKKDKNGRIVDPDDQEARQAARELRAAKKAAPAKQAAPKAKAPVQEEKRPARTPKPRQERAAKPAPKREGQSTPKREPPKQGVRPGSLLDTGDAMPETNLRRPSPLDGDRIMDATARLLAPRKPMFAASRPSEQERERPRRKRDGGREQKPAHSTEQRAKDTGRKQDGKSASHNQPKQAANAPAEKREGKGADGQRDNRRPRNDRRGGRQGGGRQPDTHPSQTKDSTEQKTLMKPYYLDS